MLYYFFYGVLVAETCSDPETKFRQGWFSVVCICLLFIVQVGNICFDFAKKTYLKLKLSYYQK